MNVIINLVKLSIILFALTLGQSTYAFDPIPANLELDRLTVTLSTQNLSSKELQIIQKELIELKRQAEQCVEDKTKELADINAQLPQTQPNEQVTFTTDQEFLLTRKNEINL